jgi:hypothetical protein
MNKFGQRPPVLRYVFPVSPIAEKSFPVGMNFADKHLQQRKERQMKAEIELGRFTDFDQCSSPFELIAESRMYRFGWF